MPPTLGGPALIERLIAVLQSEGIDTDAILTSVGIDPSLMADSGALFPITAAMEAFALGSAALNDPHVGLRSAAFAIPARFGVVGFILANHATIGEGLADVARVSKVILPALSIGFEPHEDGSGTFWLGFATRNLGTDCFVEDVLAGACACIGHLTGRPVTPAAVTLQRSDGNAKRLRAAFGVEVTQGASRNGVTLGADVLSRAVAGANSVLLTHLHEAATTVAARRRQATATRSLVQLTDCIVDMDAGSVHRDGKALSLTAREMEVIEYLVAHANKVVSHQELEESVWSVGSDTVSYAPAVAVRRLRRKLERDPAHPTALLTVHGEGWKLVVPTPQGDTEPPSV